MVWERANELAEVRLEVDHDMVCAMCDLTCAMGHVNMGVLSVVGAGAPGVSMGVGWLGEHEEGTSKEKGKGKERAVQEGVREGRFELGDVEHGVDPSELLWEADCNGVHAQGAYYLEWSQVLLCQFP